jgi:hypothetical protein
MRLNRSRTNQLLQRLYERGRWLAQLLILAALLALPACGGRSANSGPGDADAAHQAWVAAVRGGNTDAAQTLADPQLPDPAAFAHDAVGRMQEYLTSPASPTGALQSVTLGSVSGDVGRSVWQFASKRWCYRAELVERAGRWYVSRWGQTSVDCP